MKLHAKMGAFLLSISLFLAILKKIGVVPFSWAWVFAPVWIPGCALLGIIIAVCASVIVKELTVQVRHDMNAKARARNIDAEAEKHGLRRNPGESNAELMGRIACVKQLKRKAGR